MTIQRSPGYFDGRMLTASDLTRDAAGLPAVRILGGDPDAPVIIGSVPNPA